MSISLKTHKKLWGLAANRCAFENCRKELIVDTFSTDDYYSIGDEAHIISARPKGPRYLNDFPSDQIDKYDNLILLCKEHHKIIDSDIPNYAVEKVRKIKRAHEEWVAKNLDVNLEEQRDDELFADYVDNIQLLADFDRWFEWSAKLLGGRNTGMPKYQFENLVKLNKFLKGRVYPKNRPDLYKAIIQFNNVLGDFVNEFDLFNDYGEEIKEHYITQQLYRKGLITGEKQEIHEYTLEELVFDLTRSANFLCDQVRKTIFPGYRLKDGVLLLKDDPINGISYKRLEYKKNEKYSGLYNLKLRLKKRLNI